MAEELRRNQCSRVWATAAYRNGKRQGTGRGTGFLAEDIGRRGKKGEEEGPGVRICLPYKTALCSKKKTKQIKTGVNEAEEQLEPSPVALEKSLAVLQRLSIELTNDT